MPKKLNSNDERKVGFTLRVGGGKSPIQDRRNWDGYIVNNKIVRLKPKHGLEMMGFLNLLNYQFQIIKQ